MNKPSEVKSGITTSEFYVAAGTSISIALMAFTGIPIPPEITIGALTTIGSIYAIVRGWVKTSANK
jgi:hypothetical protein